MSQTETLETMGTPSWHMIRALGGVGTFCALLIAFTYQLTLPTITAKKAIYLQKAVYRTLPGAVSSVTFALNDSNQVVLAENVSNPSELMYAGYDESGKLVGIALQAAGPGFQDVIRLLYGYDPQTQTVIGFQVLESRETPGLGDKIEKDAVFLENFKALDVSLDSSDQIQNAIVMVPKGAKTQAFEIDAISGATISSRAVANMLREHTGRILPILAKQTHVFQEKRP